jgi:hypothetical protein
MNKGSTKKTTKGNTAGNAKRGNTKGKTSGKANPRQQPQEEQTAEREAILDERESLKRLFPPAYSPDIGVFNEDTVEVMFKLTRSQAESLARLLKEHKL